MAIPREVQKIVLSKSETALLKKLRKGCIVETPDNKEAFIPLLRAGVARQSHTNWQECKIDKSIPAVMTWAITEDGEHYLVYRNEQWRRSLITPVIVTVLANIVWRLLEWLLPLAKEWLISILS